MSTRKELAGLISRMCSTLCVDISDDLVTGYVDSLVDLDFVFVKAAADDLLRESRWMPKPAEIRSLARKLEAEANPRIAEPEVWRRDTYTCPICLDYGWVTVWSPESMRTAVEHVQGRIPGSAVKLTECAAKCTCEAGQKKPGKASTFRPVMVQLDRTLTVKQQIEALLDWARNWQPQNRVGAFDEWNVAT